MWVGPGPGVKFVLAHLSNEVRTTLEKYQITGLLDKDALFDSLRAVVYAYKRTQGGNGGESKPDPSITLTKSQD